MFHLECKHRRCCCWYVYKSSAALLLQFENSLMSACTLENVHMYLWSLHFMHGDLCCNCCHPPQQQSLKSPYAIASCLEQPCS